MTCFLCSASVASVNRLQGLPVTVFFRPANLTPTCLSFNAVSGAATNITFSNPVAGGISLMQGTGFSNGVLQTLRNSFYFITAAMGQWKSGKQVAID